MAVWTPLGVLGRIDSWRWLSCGARHRPPACRDCASVSAERSSLQADISSVVISRSILVPNLTLERYLPLGCRNPETSDN